MRIQRFWARNYRSLRDITLDGLGAFNVFYGPNGSGKSNILRGIQCLVRATELWAESEKPGDARFAAALARGVLTADDQRRSREGGEHNTTLGFEVVADVEPPMVDSELSLGRILHKHLRIELSVEWSEGRPFSATFDVRFDGNTLPEAEVVAKRYEPGASARATLARVASRLFWLIGADRALRDEQLRDPPSTAAATSTDAPALQEDPILAALREGRLQTAIFHAKNDWKSANRHRFSLLQSLLAETLHLPPLDVGRDPGTGLIDLRQPLPGSTEIGDISMRSAGLGVEQVVAIIASVLFARCAIGAIEEPEAHLHAPTTGRALRKLLKRIVEPGEGAPRVLHQLFVATHSNLFDLDPSGYWDVRLVEGATLIERKALRELYGHHLYEPGPAKLLLVDALTHFGDEVVFRAKDGRRIEATEMLKLLDEDDDLALEFLRDMHAAALAALRVRATRREGKP